MKKVRLKSDEISIDELNDSHLIGVEFKSGIRGFVIKFDINKYAVAARDAKANNYSELVVWKDIKMLIKDDMVSSSYVFETPKELCLWMAEGGQGF